MAHSNVVPIRPILAFVPALDAAQGSRIPPEFREPV